MIATLALIAALSAPTDDHQLGIPFSGGSLTLDTQLMDGVKLYLGTGQDAWWDHNPNATCFTVSDSDGGGTDSDVICHTNGNSYLDVGLDLTLAAGVDIRGSDTSQLILGGGDDIWLDFNGTNFALTSTDIGAGVDGDLLTHTPGANILGVGADLDLGDAQKFINFGDGTTGSWFDSNAGVWRFYVGGNLRLEIANGLIQASGSNNLGVVNGYLADSNSTLGLGAACTTTHGAGSGDACAPGIFEVQGAAFFDGGVTLGAATHLVLPLEDDASTPTLAWGDGDSGIAETSDDIFKISFGGTYSHVWSESILRGATSGGYWLTNGASGATVATFSFFGDNNTGVGSSGPDHVSLIGGATELARHGANLHRFTQLARDVGATCTVGDLAYDTGGATDELCFCHTTNTWGCVSMTTTAGPTD